MQCHEIQESFVDLLYDEKGSPAASPELQEHIRSCADCQKKLAELKALQSMLKVWEDEPPLRRVVVPVPEPVSRQVLVPWWRLARYGAIAALITLAFLGLSNAQITWDNNGFSFRTSLIAPAAQDSNSYTKKELQEVIQRVMEDSHDFSLQMAQRVLETIDQQRVTDYRTLARQIKESHSKNEPAPQVSFGPLEGEDK